MKFKRTCCYHPPRINVFYLSDISPLEFRSFCRIAEGEILRFITLLVATLPIDAFFQRCPPSFAHFACFIDVAVVRNVQPGNVRSRITGRGRITASAISGVLRMLWTLRRDISTWGFTKPARGSRYSRSSRAHLR